MRTLRHGPMVALASVALVLTIGGPLRELHEHGVLGTYRRVRQVVFEKGAHGAGPQVYPAGFFSL